MRKELVEKLVEIVTAYEDKYNGALKHGYSDIETFKSDLQEDIAQNGVNELLEYYNAYVVCSNDTNSTPEQRKELDSLVLVLQGQATK